MSSVIDLDAASSSSSAPNSMPPQRRVRRRLTQMGHDAVDDEAIQVALAAADNDVDEAIDILVRGERGSGGSGSAVGAGAGARSANTTRGLARGSGSKIGARASASPARGTPPVPHTARRTRRGALYTPSSAGTWPSSPASAARDG